MALPSRAGTRAGPEIRARQERHFGSLLRRVLQSNEFYRAKYREAGISLTRPLGLSDCRDLPFTERSELLEDQRRHPPLGSNLTMPASRLTRIHREERDGAEGLAWGDTAESWEWSLRCWMTVLEAAGVGPEQCVAVFSSFGPRPEPWAALEAAQRLGALSVPADATEPGAPLAWLGELEPSALVCRPEELELLADSDLTPSTAILLADAPPARPGAPEGLRGLPDDARVHWAVSSAELGPWGHTCAEGDALHVNEGEFVVEIIDPRTGDPVECDGPRPRRGELVLTNLGREVSPLIRYRTGLRVALAGRGCACGAGTAVLALPSSSR